MYTLRMIREKIDRDTGVELSRSETNINLGNSYSVIKNTNTEEFLKQVKNFYPEIDARKVRVIVNDENDFAWFLDFIQPKTEYVEEFFIMTENGKTFERL